MKKKIILLVVLLAVLASFFIPVTLQKTISVKSPFLNLYAFLSSPEKWERWQPDLRKDFATDSNKIAVHKDTSAFNISSGDFKLTVKRRGNAFGITETRNDKTSSYDYSLLPVLDKFMNKTLITAEKKITLANYLAAKFWPDTLRDTHLYDLKTFIETDSLRYGYKILDARVPESFVIEMKKKVLTRNEFSEAGQMFAALRQYIKAHDIKQLEPVLAQFLPKGKDSVQVNVGFFIDKAIKSDNEFLFVSMPKGGQLYAIKYRGRFDKRYLVYTAAHQYYADHSYRSIVLPFETYLDNKLPATDTSTVHIQVNFSSSL